MEVWMILQKIRDDIRLKNFENNFKEFRRIMNILKQAGPFIGRILTQEKCYSGLIEKLKLNDNQLEFRIVDCDAEGRTNGNSKTYREKIYWKYLKDIQVLKSAKGEPLRLDDLLNREMEEKND